MSLARQLAVVGFMLALAAIDFAAALVAQDLSDRRRISTLVVGSVLSISLFVVYAAALHLADLSIVTMGWIVMLQVAVICWDVARNGLHLSAAQWTAVTLIIVLQVFLTASTQRSDKPAAGLGPYPSGLLVGQTSAGTTPVRSPVTRNTTLRATDTAWSANRS